MADNAVMGAIKCPVCGCTSATAKEMKSGAYIVCPPEHDGGCNAQFMGRSKTAAHKIAKGVTKWASTEARKKHLGAAAPKVEPVVVEAVEVVAAPAPTPEPMPAPPPKRSMWDMPISDVLGGLEMTEALDTMISEAGGLPEAGGAGEAAPAPVSTAPAPLPEFVQAVTVPLVEVVGAIACDAARVTSLERNEVEALAGAVNNVLRFYLTLDGLDQKTAAWLALGAVGLGVVQNRKSLPPKDAAPPVVPVVDIPSEAQIIAAQTGALAEMTGGGGAAAGA
jgi:hypothetical protein